MRIKVINCGKVKKADIEFEPGLNIIRGESGSGKSTVLRGIENLVFNSGGDEVITQGESEARLTVDYNNNVVTKIRKPGKPIYEINGDILSTVGRLPVQDVLKCFGFKEIKTEKGSIRPNFLSQFSYPFLVNESSSRIFEYLTITSKSLNLNGVENAINSDINELKQQKKSKEDTINTLKKMVLNSKDIIDKKEEINKISNLYSNFEKKKNKFDVLKSYISKIENILQLMKCSEEKINKIESSLFNINNLNIDYNKINKKTRCIERLEQIINRLNTNNIKSKVLLEKINIFEKYKVNNDNIDSLFNKLNCLQSSLLKHEESLSSFNKIKKQGLSLKEENESVMIEIESFKNSNIPVIVIETNRSLANSLHITLNDIVNTLSSCESS